MLEVCFMSKKMDKRNTRKTLRNLLVYLFSIVTVLQMFGEVEAVSNCYKNCENEPECSKHTALQCYNGQCTTSGDCACAPCWQGRNCNTPANFNPPLPTYGYKMEVSIPADQPVFDVFLNIETKDLDDEARCDYTTCSCVETNFDIHADGYADKCFGIKKLGRKGGIYVNETALLKPGNVYKVIVILSNEDGLQASEVTVQISILEPFGYEDYNELNQIVERNRRALSDISPLDENDTISFTLDVLSPTPGNITNITAGTHVDLQVTIGIPPAVQISLLNFEFFAENNASTIGVVCEPGVRNTGSYITYEEASPSLDFNSENYFQAETAYLTLTNVTNSNTTSSDQLELEFGVTIFNSSELAMGELNWISVGAEFLNFSRIWVGQVGLFVDPYEMEIISSPVLGVNETITINKGESGVITLLMNIYEHSYSLEVNARIVAPVNSPVFHICKLGVRKTGDGYCLENSSPVQTFTEDMVTGYNTDAVFDFKEIIYGGQNGDMVSSLIVMDLHVYLPDVADVLPGETYAVHFDVYIDGTMHTVSDTFLAGGSVTPSESPLLPAFAITFPEIQDVFNYSPNELLQLNVAITFPVGVYRDISVEVSATGTGDPISLLSVETTQVGYNLGCFDTCQSFQPRNECPVATDVITMTQPVINHGLRCWKGDNDLSFNIFTRIPTVTLGLQTITVRVRVESTLVIADTFDVTVVDRITVPSNLPLISSDIDRDLLIDVANNHDTTVQLVLPPDTEFHYTLQVSSDVEWFVVKELNLTLMGNDLVGDLGALVQVDNFTGGMYTGSFDLGYVYNIALFPNETSTEDSTIAFDVTLGFMDGASVDDGQVANMTFAIIASDGAPTPTEDQAEIPFTVTAVNLTEFNITSKFGFTCPGSAYVLPGEITNCFLTMNFTDNKEFVIFDVEASPNTTDSVGMTIHSFRVIDIGANLMTNGEPTYSYEYVLNNAQLNRLSVDFGVITNNKTSSDPADNQLEMEIKVQATDTAENENGTELVLGTGASISDKLIWVSFTTFNIERTGSETPQLDYNFTVVDSGDLVTYDVTIQHDLGVSSAEVSALTLTIFQPPYFVYESSSSDIVFTATDSGNSLVLSVPELLFTDAISISVVYSRDCTYMFTFKEKWKATSLLQIQYQTHNRDINGVVDSGTPLGNVMKEPLQIVTFDFNVSQLISNDKKPPTCLSPTALGMESGSITDCQITASHNSSGIPFNARRNGLSAWTVGKSGPYADQRWLKIDIGQLSAVTMIQTQGGIEASVEGDIGEYEVFYSRDDIVYKRGYHMNDSTLSEIFDHRRTYPDPVPADYYDIHTTYFLARPVEARYVLVRLGADDLGDDRVYNALRVELYGCFIEALQTDICPIEKTFTRLPEEYDRGFVVNTNTDTLYVCNVMVNVGRVGLVQGILDKDTFLLKRGKRRTRCFKTQDTYAWQSLDDHIRNVIGYSPSTGGVYAIAGYTSPAYMVSYDEGLQWVEISIDDFTDASSAIDYISYKELPTESTDGFNFVNSSYVYQSHGNWEASFDGMFGLRLGSPEKILDWNTCCKT